MRLVGLLLLVACATTPKGSVKCPDKPPCMATLTCSYDSGTGCDVCHCADNYIDRGAEPPPGQAPFPH